MRISLKNLPQSQVELTFELTVEELKPYLEQAAKQLAQEVTIPGWRPGAAPYEIIKQQLGEMKIYEKALGKVVDKTLRQAVKEKNLESVGAPEVEVEKLAPGNNFVYRARLSILPQIKLAAWTKIKIKRQKPGVGENEVAAALQNIRKDLASETLVNRPAEKNDKIVADMNIFLDKAPLEGGQTKNHQIFLNEPYYIPGLPEELLGLKANEEKTFTLPFPAEHFQKNLAGKNVEFKVMVKGVFERTLPELDDALAAKVGQPSLIELKNLIQQNLETEKNQKEERRLEVEIIQTLVKDSQFGELPKILIESEKQKMFGELKAGLEERGLDFDQYLKNIGKTPEEVARDFEAGAAERAKAALLMRQIAEEEKILNTPGEVEQELAGLRELYRDAPNSAERLARPGVMDLVAANLVNRKVMELLKKAMVSS